MNKHLSKSHFVLCMGIFLAILSLSVKSLEAQQKNTRTVSGTVYDDQHTPLSGAVIRVKGTRLITGSKIDGSYQLKVPTDLELEITVTFVGMQSEKILLAKGSFDIKRDIFLKGDTELQEIVVTGVFQKSKNSYTGAVSTISERELKAHKGKDLISTLKNIDPTFNVLENNIFGSDPNHLPSVQIRGTSSLPTVKDLKNDTQVNLNIPVIILDGFEISLSRMMDMNDEDIQSVTILKDGAATAIYGSRAANGVIVIQSRRPDIGKLRLSYRYASNVEVPDLTGYELLNAKEKIQLEYEAGLFSSNFANAEMSLRERYNMIQSEIARGVDTHWLSKPLRIGVGHRHNVRIEGGTADGFRFSGSIQHNDVKGVMKGSNRTSVHGNIYLMYSKGRLNFTNQSEASQVIAKESPYGVFRQYVYLNPYWRERDDGGRIKKELEPRNNNLFNPAPENPLYNASLNLLNQTKKTFLTNNFSIEWKPFTNLTLRSRLGISKSFSRSDDFKPASHTKFKDYSDQKVFRKGSYIYSNGEGLAFDWNTTLNYTHTFAEKHLLYVGLNYDMAQQQDEAYIFRAEGFPEDNYTLLSMALQYQDKGKPQGIEATSRRIGLTGNINYAYENRYFVDYAYRIDGSSQFGKTRRFAPFYSLGIGWNIHKERFIAPKKWINRLKIRGSYAVTGSVNFSPYQALGMYEIYSNDRYRYWFGSNLIGLANKDLEWQRTHKTNLGIEFACWDERIRLTADIFRNTTDNLLSEMQLPLANGFPSYTSNIGKIENKGIELSATTVLIRTNKINWSVSASGIHERNIILSLSEALKKANQELEMAKGSNPNFLYREGEALRTIYVVPSLGIDPSTGKELFKDKRGYTTYKWNARDKEACGTLDPLWRGNINSMLTYGDFTVTISLGYRLGGAIYNSTLIDRVENADIRYNVDRRVYKDRWKNPGDQVFFKDIKDKSMTQMSSRFVQTDNTLECQNIHLQYRIPNTLTSRLWIQSLTAGVSTDHLFRLSSIRQERGIDYPFSRRFTLSLSAIF